MPPVVLSKPFELCWGGWTAMSTHLQQAGWLFSAEELFARRQLRIAIKHPEFKMYGVGQPQEIDFFRERHLHSNHIPRVNIQWMASDAVIQIMDDLSAFKPIDAYPQFTQVERKCIEDFSMFAAPLVRTEEIIVEPGTVAECMEIIKRIQIPEQTAIRERQRLAEAREAREFDAVPRQKFHAQIISIA